jgi:hypothetical protein
LTQIISQGSAWCERGRGIPEKVAMQSTHAPGQPAPISATYEQMNVFGSPTGITVRVARGHPLPGAPIGHEWAVVEEHPEEC